MQNPYPCGGCQGTVGTDTHSLFPGDMHYPEYRGEGPADLGQCMFNVVNHSTCMAHTKRSKSQS
jgi:hypothetical protein